MSTDVVICMFVHEADGLCPQYGANIILPDTSPSVHVVNKSGQSMDLRHTSNASKANCLLAVRIFGPCGMDKLVSNGRNGGDTLVELPFSTSCGPSGDVPPVRTGQRQICTNILVCMYARWATGRSLSRSHNVVEQCTEDGTAPLSVSLS